MVHGSLSDAQEALLADTSRSFVIIGGEAAVSAKLEAELKDCLNGVNSLRFDFSALDYLSSAGLRVLLAAQKRMNKQGSMTLLGVNETIAEIFEVTGFSDILTIE